MRTTLDIDDELLAEAQARIQAKSKTMLIELALQALLRQEAESELVKAAGTMPELRVPGRRKP